MCVIAYLLKVNHLGNIKEKKNHILFLKLMYYFSETAEEFWTKFSLHMHRIPHEAGAWLKNNSSENEGNSEQLKTDSCMQQCLKA